MRISNREKRRVAGINELRKSNRATAVWIRAIFYLYTVLAESLSALLLPHPRKVTPLNANCYVIRLESNYFIVNTEATRDVAARQNATLNEFTLRIIRIPESIMLKYVMQGVKSVEMLKRAGGFF